MPTFDAALASLADRFDQLRADRRLPGIAWGVVRDGKLVATGGSGTCRSGEDRRPDADSVFRIASMTKSFTAAALLLLRDEGRLKLHEPVATYVPELAGWASFSDDGGPVTVRQLLTMSSGLPTDDPWGDRQQGLDLGQFAALLADGPTLAWTPGTVFDYSNLGYGILGRVITNVAGAEYREVVRDRLLAPLGMAATTYLEEEVPAARLAHGYKRWDDELVREGTDGYGALASMGGIFTSVRDLATWVAGFTDAFGPAGSSILPAGIEHPLGRATRREMQQVHRMFGPDVAAHDPADEPVVTAGGYGYGLFVTMAPGVGTVVSHSGGYPGFGSNMSWHPASGVGVIALANHRYADVRVAVGPILEALVLADGAPRRPARRLPAVDAFRPVVERLLEHWDDAVADEAFAMNMDLDEPRERRRAAVAAAVDAVGAEHGGLLADEQRPVVSTTPASCTWWLRAPRGWIKAHILVTPEPRPRIQTLRVTPVVDPSPALCAAAQALLDLAASRPLAWPWDIPVGPALDTGRLLRSMRAAEARFGAMSLGLPIEGDGTTRATWRLATERGVVDLRIALAAGDGGGLTAGDGGTLVAPDSGTLVAGDGGALVAGDGGGLTAGDGGTLVAGDGGGPVAPDSGMLVAEVAFVVPEAELPVETW